MANFFTKTFKWFFKTGKKTVVTAGEITEETFDTGYKYTKKTIDVVETTAKGAMNLTNTAVGAIGYGLGYLRDSFINTNKFLFSETYRNEVGYPWIKSLIRENWAKVKEELDESEEMLMILWKYSKGEQVSKEEKKKAEEQLFDLIRIIPALGIFALPGGMILLPILAHALPWDLMPSAFREKVKKEYGEEALEKDLKDEENDLIDKEVEIPEDIKEKVETEVPDLVKEALKVKDTELEEEDKTE